MLQLSGCEIFSGPSRNRPQAPWTKIWLTCRETRREWQFSFKSLRRRANTLETSASESLYGGQFTLLIQLIKPNYPVINLSTEKKTCGDWAIFLSTLKSSMHFSTYYELFLTAKILSTCIIKKTNNLRFLISMTESQNTLQFSGLQVRTRSMMYEFMKIYSNCSVNVITQHLEASFESYHGWSPCAKSFSECSHSAFHSSLTENAKTWIIKDWPIYVVAPQIEPVGSGSFNLFTDFLVSFYFGWFFLLQISSKAFDSQDGKQLEESESTPSLLEQVQVSSFCSCKLMNYHLREVLNSDHFELSNKNTFLLSLFNMCLFGTSAFIDDL